MARPAHGERACFPRMKVRFGFPLLLAGRVRSRLVRVSDEIVHAMDLFPTLAAIVGGEVPNDRVIDGIDMSKFFLGRQNESGRDGIVVYMGNDIYALKWRNWKLHFKEQDGWNGVLREYPMPRAYNLLNDPREVDNVFFPHTWVPKAAGPLLEEHLASLKE